MDDFIHRLNLDNFRKRLTECTDQAQHKMLMILLAEEEANVHPPAHQLQPQQTA